MEGVISPLSPTLGSTLYQGTLVLSRALAGVKMGGRQWESTVQLDDGEIPQAARRKNSEDDEK